MKIALKYGIPVALLISLWIAFKHRVLHLESQQAAWVDMLIFNGSSVLALFLGIRERRITNDDSLTFGEGLTTGVLIAVIYSIGTTAYFALEIALAGRGMMAQNGETSMVGAFAGVSIGFLVIGAVLSAVISLLLRTKR